ncbi:MAG: recombinase RecA [Pseudomonadota bacterium]
MRRDRKEEDRPSALKQILKAVEKQFGKGTIMCMGDHAGEAGERLQVIPTGSFALDLATGVMGYPRGRLVEIFGQESSGKTTLSLHAIASAQRAGGIAAFVDAEHAFDMTYASAIGVDVSNLLISQPDYGEQALEVAEILIRSGAVDIVVVDSVAALVPRAEIEGDMGDSHMGLQARLMSQAMRKLTAITHRTNACIIFINQIRLKIGMVFGNPETTTGGTALKFYASMRLEVKRRTMIKTGDTATGNRTKVKVVKNKMAPPFREAEFDILFGKGIDGVGELFDAGVESGVIDKSGTWYSTGGERIGQGRERGVEFFRQNPAATHDLKQKILSARGMVPASEETTVAA